MIEYQSPQLLFFLETSQQYDVAGALRKCISNTPPLYREAVYLYSRLGDTSKALMIIINDLNDVDMALDFVQKRKDQDLWDDLLRLSMDKPEFVGGQFRCVGRCTGRCLGRRLR